MTTIRQFRSRLYDRVALATVGVDVLVLVVGAVFVSVAQPRLRDALVVRPTLHLVGHARVRVCNHSNTGV
jgi:hypothetical protein